MNQLDTSVTRAVQEAFIAGFLQALEHVEAQLQATGAQDYTQALERCRLAASMAATENAIARAAR